MITRISSKHSHVTRDLSKSFRDMTPAPGDRDFDKAKYTIIKNAVVSGKFYSYVWASCYCKETGTTYRINGKHGSHYFSNEAEQLGDNMVVVEHWATDTLAEVSDLYRQFDNMKQSRKTGDVLKSYVATSPVPNTPLPVAKSCLLGFSISEYGDQYHAIDQGTRATALLHDNTDFVQFVTQHYDWSSTKLFSKSAVAVVLYRSFRESPELAGAFWSAVKTGSGPDPKSPDRLLRDYLLSHKLKTGGKNSVEVSAMIKKCSTCWSQWKANLPTDKAEAA